MLIDSHCHLGRFSERGDLDEVLNEASLAGVNRMITVGTDPDEWKLYQSLSARHEGVIDFAVGLHPSEVDSNWETKLEELRKYLELGSDHCPVAIGEMGLDYFHLPKDEEEKQTAIELQKQAFSAQLELARECGLPIIIHCRDSFDDCVKILDTSKTVWDRVVFHCFSGGKDEIDRINLRGGRGSFTGIVTYDNSSCEPVREALIEQGVERLLIETDCPYLTPVPHKGKENRPSYLRYTFQRIAAILQIPVLELEDEIAKNTLSFFNLK
ncbi:MAG: TatD family hydrolase [Opitutales bacterium]|nr:TatD family hydrolase [Opitutales bacterium]